MQLCDELFKLCKTPNIPVNHLEVENETYIFNLLTSLYWDGNSKYTYWDILEKAGDEGKYFYKKQDIFIYKEMMGWRVG